MKHAQAGHRRMITRIPALMLACLLLFGCTGKKDTTPDTASRAGESAPLSAPTSPEDITIDLSDNIFSFREGLSAQEKKENTVLIYMVGTNLETEHYAASADLYEIAASGLDPEKTNVVICTGGTKGWRYDIPSDTNALLRYRGKDDIAIEATSRKLSNMGNPKTLVDFLNFSASAYPAEHYALIFWDHGLGPVQGFGYDEIFEDVMELTEMEAALAASVFAKEERLDWIGFDACLMATVELAQILSAYTGYLIASQETENGYGWDFSFLSAYDDTSDPERIADAVLTSFADFFEEHRTPYFNPEYTLSCMKLSESQALTDAMDALFTKMEADLSVDSYKAYATARVAAKSFGIAASGGVTESLDLIDIKDYSEEIGARFPEEAASLKSAVERMVIAEVSNVERAYGISMYYPYYNDVLYTFFGLDAYGAYRLPESYTRFMNAFYAMRTGTQEEGETQEEVEGVFADMDRGEATENEVTLTLTGEQLARTDRITYTVFAETTEGAYTPIVATMRAEADADGVVHIDCAQSLYAAVTDLGARVIWPVVQLERGDKRNLYQTINAQMHNTYEFFPWGDSDNYSVTFAEDNASGAITVTEVEKDTDNFEIDTMTIHNGKTTVDVGDWDYIAYSFFRYVPDVDEDGRTLPFTLWASDGYGFTEFLELDRTFHFERVPMSETPENKYVQIIVRDDTGALHASDLLPLHDPEVPDSVSAATPAGELDFYVYDDHAELIAYEGTDTALTIPAQAGGKPLTVIGSQVFYNSEALESVTMPDTVTRVEHGAFLLCKNLSQVQLSSALEVLSTDAFRGCTALSEIALPEGLKTIGVYAFGATALTEIMIPASVTDIRPGAFSDNVNLTRITVGEGSPYTVKEDVLFTEDETRLVCYPAGLDAATYAIPAGVKEIADYAFVGNEHLTGVTYPESLTEIGEFSFYDTRYLTDAYEFPDALTRIGAGAFYQVHTNREEDIGRIRIGAQVAAIGKDAFGDRRFDAFDVEDTNPYYADRDGALTNKSGDYLLFVPTSVSGTYTIPEGVSVVDDRAFSITSDIEALVVSDGVLYLGGFSLPGKSFTIGAGLMEWRGVSGLMYDEITIDPDNAYFTADGLIIYDKEMTTLLNYPYAATEKIYEIPEGVTTIARGAFTSPHLEILVIPASLTEGLISRYGSSVLTTLDGLTEIRVHEDNPAYCAYNGMLYTKDMKTAVSVPQEHKQVVSFAEGTEHIAGGAMYEISNTTEIYVPEGVTSIGNMTTYIYVPTGVEDMTVDLYLPASVTEIHSSIFSAEVRAIARGEESVLTVHCPAGSYADSFFRERGIRVVNE